jgi:hypothetical protein
MSEGLVAGDDDVVAAGVPADATEMNRVAPSNEDPIDMQAIRMTGSRRDERNICLACSSV